MSQVVRGTVHGTTIELHHRLDVPDGQEVEVTVRPASGPVDSQPWGDGLRRCAGTLADVPGLDHDMGQILAERRTARFREVAE